MTVIVRPLPCITVSAWCNLLCCVYITSCHWHGSQAVENASSHLHQSRRWLLWTACLNKLWL